MGISTVSGPFRSQNGFQELVDGVWTPVGGGGGTSLIVLPDSTTNLVFTEPGQIITATSFNPTNGFYNTFTFTATVPQSGYVTEFSGFFNNVNAGGFPLTNISSSPNLTFGFSIFTVTLQLTFVFIGYKQSGMYGPSALISVAGFAPQY